jgi:cellulose synthase/poly-beta-1,6-N-acetylglucosamine synthase-like glycosyltransferase
MQTIIALFLTACSIAVAIPTATLCIEILAAFLRSKNRPPLSRGPGSRVALLVPARNESAGISATLEGIKAQLRLDDLLLVVADNCTDNTAQVARAAGATVIERQDTVKIGKGYALDFGLRFLQREPPAVVIVIDADCQLSPGAIEQLAATAIATQRPVQALYLMRTAAGARINQQVAEFAWRIKNWVRPLGLHSFGLPCQLMGTGMAFPWPIIQVANLANGSIVEDLKLGLELTEAGHPPLFCPSARVISQFASTTRGEETQRQRWEHGHIATIMRQAPRLFLKALVSGNLNLLALTLDLAVPPLSLLAMLLILSFVVTAPAALLGFGMTALVVSAASVAAFVLTVGMAWRTYGREVLPGSAVAAVPLYVLRKFGLYRKALAGNETKSWIGTDRAKTPLQD